MTDDEFKKLVLQELTGIKDKVAGIEIRTENIETRTENIETRTENIETRMGSIETRMENIETRQDEIYQIVKAIEHSNQVGRAEMDSQNVKLAKIEGKLKKTAEVLSGDIEAAGI